MELVINIRAYNPHVCKLIFISLFLQQRLPQWLLRTCASSAITLWKQSALPSRIYVREKVVLEHSYGWYIHEKFGNFFRLTFKLHFINKLLRACYDILPIHNNVLYVLSFVHCCRYCMRTRGKLLQKALVEGKGSKQGIVLPPAGFNFLQDYYGNSW